MNVQSVSIGECVKVIGGFAFKSKDFGETGKPVIRISNLQNGIVNTEGAVKILPEKVGKGSKATIIGGDILMALSGATTGKIGVVPVNIEGPVYLNQRVGKFEIVNNMMIERAYLRHYLESEMIQSQVWKSAAGVAQPNISPKQLEAYQIPLPPLSEQKRIAAILDKADALREKRRQAIAKLDELLQSVFLDMFGDPVTNPKGWEVKKCRELYRSAPKIGTIRPAKGEGFKVVRVGELGQRVIDFDNCGRVELSNVEFERFSLNIGDTVIARAIGSKKQLGKASFFDGYHEPIVIDSHVMRLRPNQDVCDPKWFYFLIASPRGKLILQSKGGPTAVQFNINSKQANDLEIPLPPISNQRVFSHLFSTIESEKVIQGEHLSKIDTLFASLQQRAFKGEL
ncbi:MAG: restriction endonuclease subunit S [Desulfobacteraceae bacterium]|nr:restriction endonuclease subunit S [Desulfobacteraceae bacterium]